MPGQLTLPLGPIRNSNLFSSHWLERRLPLEPEWTELRPDAERMLDSLTELWREQRSRAQQYAEQGLENVLISPILTALGWKVDYQPPLRGRTPDYALFADDEKLDAALSSGRGTADFWKLATMVGDAKAWNVSLDRPTRVAGKREYPPEQIEWYIERGGCEYGILTNGKLWRLHSRQLSPHQPRFETYLECDLAAILEGAAGSSGQVRQRSIAEHTQLIDDFLRFFLFFSPRAFTSTKQRTSLIDRAVTGSNEYRLGIGEGLKGRVFEALRICMQGFLAHSPNGLDSHEDLGMVKEQSLILLYRLLFVMYGEDRGLLPYRTNRTYRDNRSLSHLRDEIACQIDRFEFGTGPDFDQASCELWEDLRTLFDLIDRGGRRYGVPAYNGGLFDPEESPFLHEKALPDWFLARVIDQLGRAPDSEHPDAGPFRVDYRDLSIQHLGHVYEGLLELQPCCATQPMVVVRKTDRTHSRELVIPASSTLPRGFAETDTRYEAGEVYLVNDKGERRTTGSYYTPNHVVDYIVDRTLGSLCQQTSDALAREIETTQAEMKRRRGRNRELLASQLENLCVEFDDRILRLKILDPAMGSGHFLLRACQYLAEEIATSPYASDPRVEHLEDDESVLTYWKRRVVENCLYGVDMNPLAVELAKVALWLETASRNEPLTFLDHHLRHGNSLVGGAVGELGSLPGENPMPLFEQQAASRLPILLDGLRDISDIPSETAEQVKRKTRLYHRAVDKARAPLIAVADLWCANFYLTQDERITPDLYAGALHTLATPSRYKTLTREQWFRVAVSTAHRPDVASFHWELEFPEVFFDKSGRREDAGFDAVIGNPPYDVLSEKETGRNLSAFRNYLKAKGIYEPSFRGKNNLYKLFICLALSLLREGGRMGFITPMAVLGDDQAAEIRKQILRAGAFTSIDAFPQKDDATRRVFPEAKLSTAVFTLIKTADEGVKSTPFKARVHPDKYIRDDSPGLDLTTASIPLYDPANLTIVSCSQEDWDLAVKIMGSGRMRRLRDFAVFYQGEVNETVQRTKGTLLAPGEGGRLVVRGASICLYVPRAASQGSDLYLDVDAFLRGKGENTKAHHYRYPRIGLQESSPQNNFRRIIAAMIPAGEFCNHTVNYLPEHKSDLPLEVPLAMLNSKLADWYFRLGSTNAHVSHYQLGNLPCPSFAAETTPSDEQVRETALSAIRQGDMEAAFDTLAADLNDPPFSQAVRDTIVALVRRIMQAEQARGDISRAERSRLCPEAQVYQGLIDRIFYAMAGLTQDEVEGLEDRLGRML